jgi:hypothetical protein
MRAFLKCLAVLLLVLVVAASSSTLHAQDRFQIFGGYSYVRASIPVTETIPCPVGTCPITTSDHRTNLNGWEVSATYKPGRILGYTADFSGHYGTTRGASTHLQTYLFGPQLSFPAPVSPFLHVLIGGAHESIDSGSPNPSTITLPTSHGAFAAALGVGIDLKVLPFVSVRPIQFDYLWTTFHGGVQSQPRVSAGVILRF